MQNKQVIDNPRRRFREHFAKALALPSRWFGNIETVWVDNEQRLHGLYLHNYGGTICQPVWRAQVNHIDPRPVWWQSKTITLGKVRYCLRSSDSWDETESVPVASYVRAKEAFSFELSYHADETEAIASWLGEILTAHGLGKNTSQPTVRTPQPFRFPESPVRFCGEQDEVLESIFQHHGYLWTNAAEIAYDAALAQKNARDKLRAQYLEECKRQMELGAAQNSGIGESSPTLCKQQAESSTVQAAALAGLPQSS